MNENLNIEICTTVVESPFSNSTVEHHNLMAPEATEITLEHKKCETEITLAKSVSAKNAHQNHFGLILNEVVFRFKINTPSILTDQLPVLESAIISNMVTVKLNAAKKTFMEDESSQKNQRAVRCNVRTYTDERFVTVDSICYRRPNCKWWGGSVKVLGKEGRSVCTNQT